MSQPDSTTNPPKFLFFVVHGMGRQDENRVGTTLEAKVALLRKSCQELVGVKYPDLSDGDVAFMPIEWHSKLHSLPLGDQALAKITLPNLLAVRELNNHYLADVLYYYTPFHGQKIIDIVCGLLDHAYRAFLLEHPNFNGKIGFLGHSLGSIISYDILANQPGSPKQLRPRQELTYPALSFQVSYLFCLGSPLSPVLTMRGDPMVLNDPPFAGSARIYNIFHPYDPMAYRLEPLIASPSFLVKRSASPVGDQSPRTDTFPEPETVEHWAGGKRIHRRVAEAVRGTLAWVGGVAGWSASSYIATSDSEVPILDSQRRDFAGEQQQRDDFTSSLSVDTDQRTPPASELELGAAQAEQFSLQTGSTGLMSWGWNAAAGVLFPQPSSPPLNASSPTEKSPIGGTSSLDFSSWSSYFFLNRSSAETAKSETELNEAPSSQVKMNLRRTDFVLQESPLEAPSEYLAGFRAHFSYWGNKDVVLFILSVCLQKPAEDKGVLPSA